MSGFFGISSKANCAQTLFYGTDYHSHLGTEYGGMAILSSDFQRQIRFGLGGRFGSAASLGGLGPFGRSQLRLTQLQVEPLDALHCKRLDAGDIRSVRIGELALVAALQLDPHLMTPAVVGPETEVDRT